MDRIVKKYGSERTFFFFPEMSLKEAERLISYADENWSNIKGTYTESIGL